MTILALIAMSTTLLKSRALAHPARVPLASTVVPVPASCQPRSAPEGNSI